MKKFALVILILFAVETYGVYGAAVAKHITYTCTLDIGPLCYAWEQNAIGKLLGPDGSSDLEDTLEDARKAWEDGFVERALEAKKSGGNAFQKALDGSMRAMKDQFENLHEKFKDVVK